jgi:hypothetical protein
MGKGIGTAAVWLGPALAVWVTGEPWVAFAFICSVFATLGIWEGDGCDCDDEP